MIFYHFLRVAEGARSGRAKASAGTPPPCAFVRSNERRFAAPQSTRTTMPPRLWGLLSAGGRRCNFSELTMRTATIFAVIVAALGLAAHATPARAREYPWCARYDTWSSNCGFYDIQAVPGDDQRRRRHL